MHTPCTPTSKCHEKVLKKIIHLLLIVFHISTKSHIDIHYILDVTKRQNSDSFEVKNCQNFDCFDTAKI